jgi:hypothetical protein
LVFVEDATESVTSSDVESSEWVRFGDRLGSRRRGAAARSVRWGRCSL